MNGKNNTRNEILELADSLLIERGFSSFSYKHIAVALGMRNAAIHYHFPSKSDLGVALVQRHRQRFSAWSAACDNEKHSAESRIKAFVAIRMATGSPTERILAPESLVSADYQVLPEEMQEEARALMQDMINWLSETLRLGLAQGEFMFKQSHEDMALLLACTLHGAPQMAQANTGYSAKRVAETLLQLIQSPAARSSSNHTGEVKLHSVGDSVA